MATKLEYIPMQARNSSPSMENTDDALSKQNLMHKNEHLSESGLQTSDSELVEHSSGDEGGSVRTQLRCICGTSDKSTSK